MGDLKSIRQEKGLTQQDLAGLIGMRQGSLAEIERGKRLPRKATRSKISGILGSEIDWVSTLTRDKGHIGYTLKELLNFQEPGVQERLKFCRQYLNALEKLNT